MKPTPKFKKKGGGIKSTVRDHGKITREAPKKCTPGSSNGLVSSL